ncbi:MAG: hypothetical protein HY671_04640 [Chloroflexi bacterium]|nr:hypothetical protein [Chloroflexota bacterium]
MSKLIDSLSKLSKSSPTPMGFRAASLPRPAPMLLVGQLPRVNKETLDAVKGSNVDAVVAELEAQGSDPQALSRLNKLLAHIPWGVWWTAGIAEDGAALAEAGADFMVADLASTPAAILAEKRLGHILAMDQTLGDGMVAAVDALGTNALLLRAGFEDASFLTIGNLLACQRVARLQRKPLLVSVSLDLKAADLQALVGAGIKGVVVRLPDKGAAQRAAEMKNVLGTLSAVKKEAEEVIVPRLASEPSHEDEGEP